MSKIGKAEVISKLAEKSNVSKKVAGDMMTNMVEVITEALVEGDSVSIVGFGSFSVKKRVERVGRNPQSGEPMTIPSFNGVVFKSSTTLKETVNNQ